MAFRLAELFVDVAARMGPVQGALGGLRTQLAGLAATRFAIGGGFSLALGLGAGVLAIRHAVAGASDLAETLSKVEQVFGPASVKVKGFADQMAASLGLPKREILDAASNFGLIFTGAGIAEAKAADMAVQMAKLAADCSSFYNVPVPDALEKIRAGLTGESEPLKAFGVLMNEDAVKAKALALHLSSAGKELTEQAKIQARLAIIVDKTRKASGDLERTADGASNQFRKFSGTVQNLSDNLGTVLLPVATKAIQLLNEITTDMASGAASSTGAWAGFVDVFTSGIEYAGLIYRNFGSIIERTGVMIGGALLNVWEVWSYGGDVVIEVGKFIVREMQAAFSALQAMSANVGDNLGQLFSEVYDYITSGFQDPIEVNFKSLLDGVEMEHATLKLPEFSLSSVDNQIAEIDARMAGTEAEKAKKNFNAAQAAAAAGKAVPGGAGVQAAPATKVQNLVTDADSYAKELQEAALKSSSKAEDKVVAAVQEGNKISGQIRDQLAKGNRGGAAVFR